ncbi:pyridoxamine 5'-phosphate oxidase [Candidatus Rhodobacter oscarellae]|nr:pyridoxamine 5'-phosphate oxidase [Candidatus Rhodobacter lobularis]
MDDRTGIFRGDTPFTITRAWLDEARRTEPNDPDAVSLATVDQDGLPNVRVVLLRRIDDQSFVFFTNYESAKGQELLSAGKAALVFHWKSLRRQVRVRGLVSKEDGQVADEYYASRALGSRIGAWASKQSSPLASREVLMQDVANAEAEHGSAPSRPPFWGGFRVTPLEVEFWADGEYRLHNRFLWRRKKVNAEWCVTRLYP